MTKLPKSVRPYANKKNKNIADGQQLWRCVHTALGLLLMACPCLVVGVANAPVFILLHFRAARYLYLDVAMQKQLARAIGTTPETIIQNLLDIDLGTALF